MVSIEKSPPNSPLEFLLRTPIHLEPVAPGPDYEKRKQNGVTIGMNRGQLVKLKDQIETILMVGAPLPEGRIRVEIHDKEKGRIMLRLPKLDFVIRPDTARRLTTDLLKVMRENNIIQSPQDQEDEGKDTRICSCCKRNLPEDVDICFQCVGYSHFEPKQDYVEALPCRTCGNLEWGVCDFSSIPTDLKEEDGSCRVWTPIKPEEKEK